MNNSQTIIFTAIPRGVTWNIDTNTNIKTLPVSVFVSPRLSGENVLSAYPDWLDWTARRHEYGLSITFQCNGNTLTVEAPRDKLRPDLWTALFNKDTKVDSFTFDGDDYYNRFVPSYSVRDGSSALKATYQAAAISLAIPAPDYLGGDEGSWRRRVLRSLLDGYEVNWNPQIGDKWRKDQKREQRSHLTTPPSGPKYSRNQIGSDTLLKTGIIKPGSTASSDLHKSLVQRYAVFNHIPPGAPGPVTINHDTVLDFHKALTSLNNYPILQRMLGLVFDMELPVDFIALSSILGGTPSPGYLKITNVDGHWDTSTTTTIPTTKTAYIHTRTNSDHIFYSAPRYFSDHIEPLGVQGLLNLDPSYYGIAQVDVDGSINKTIILAEVMT